MVLPVVAALFVAAGCGSSSSKPSSSSTKIPSPAGTVVTSASNSLGKILVASNGHTLYIFAKDTPPTSSCYGACATLWPPLLTKGKPVASGGVSASHLGTTKRTDGTLQVTYYGHPLYTYVSDSAAGDTTGQALNLNGGLWYVIGVDGTVITKASSSASTGGY